MLNAKMDHLCGLQPDIFAVLVEALEKKHEIRVGAEQLVESDDWKFFSKLPQHHHGCILPHICVVWLLVHLQPIDRLLQRLFNVLGCYVAPALGQIAKADRTLIDELDCVVV